MLLLETEIIIKKYNNFMKFESKTTLDSTKQTYALLPEDDYQFTIISQKPRTQQKYQSDEMEDVIDFTLEITGFKDGEPAVDVDGQPANGRKLWLTARPLSVGFTQAGVASITRQLVCYGLGIEDVESDFELESWEQLVGKTIYGQVIQKTNQKGQKVNRIVRFTKPPRKKV